MDKDKLTTQQEVIRDMSLLISSTKSGQKLPSEPRLAEMLGVSRTIIREVLPIFENQGILRREHGKGTFVTHLPPTIDSGLEVLHPIETLAQNFGLEVRCAKLKILPRPARKNEISLLGLDDDATIIQISRLMEVETRPVAYMMDFLPKGLIPLEELSEDFDGSVLRYFLSQKNKQLSTVFSEINPHKATNELSATLDVPIGEVILTFSSTSFNKSGEKIYHSVDHFVSKYFSFHILRKVTPFSMNK
jgi:GntR family transcriptional regulator